MPLSAPLLQLCRHAIDASVGAAYARVKSNLPITEPLQEAINQFFVEVHA